MFIVVNRFDNIHDQDRCQRLILNQVQALSPHTFKESAELVHFVSSNAIPYGINPGSGIDKPDDDDPSADIMFKRRRDVMARHVDANINVWDFFALDALIPNQEKIAGTSVAMTLVNLLGGRTISGFGWADGVLGTIKIMGLRNTHMLLLPSLLLATVSAAAYVLHQIPTFLPRRLGAKLSASMIELDFTHTNSERISGEVRKILRLPADNLRVGLRHSLEKLTVKREMMGKVKNESEVARKYFAILMRESGELKSKVDDMDLEGLRGT